MDCSPPDSSVHGILQARILEWIAIPFSRGSSWPRDWTQVFCTAGKFFTIWAAGSCGCLYSVVSDSFATLWTVAHQVLCPWGFPGKDIRVGCHLLLQGIFPTQGLNLCLLHLLHFLHWQADCFTTVSPGKPHKSREPERSPVETWACELLYVHS